MSVGEAHQQLQPVCQGVQESQRTLYGKLTQCQV